MLREFGSSIAGAVTVGDPEMARQTQPRYELISDGEIIQRLRRAASDGDLGSDDQSRSMLAGYQPKLLLARFGDQWYLPRGRAHSTHILKPRLPGRPDGLAREHYGHALAAELGLAHYRTELVGKGARQYLVIERYDRAVHGETVTLIHQEDSAQALGLDWVDDHSKFQNPDAPRDSRRPSAYRIAELLGSLQGEGRPVADFLRRLTFTVLLGDNDAHAKNLAILHLPGRSVLADVYDTAPNLFQEGRIDYNLALAVDGSFDHRLSAPRISSAKESSGTPSGPARQSGSSPRPWPTSRRHSIVWRCHRASARRRQRSSRGTSSACKRAGRSASDRADTGDGVVVPDYDTHPEHHRLVNIRARLLSESCPTCILRGGDPMTSAQSTRPQPAVGIR
jgi:HipA-like C-terminal domain